MKEVVFTKEVIIERKYKVSLKNFMDKHFKEAHKYKDELDVYVESGTNSGYLRNMMSVKLLPEELNLDFNDVVNVKLVLKRHLKEE